MLAPSTSSTSTTPWSWRSLPSRFERACAPPCCWSKAFSVQCLTEPLWPGMPMTRRLTLRTCPARWSIFLIRSFLFRCPLHCRRCRSSTLRSQCRVSLGSWRLFPRLLQIQASTPTITARMLARPSILAEHLRTNVWCASSSPPPGNTVLHDVAFQFTPFSYADLQRALARLKSGRAPGPDNIPSEWWRCTPRCFRLLILHHFNSALLGACAPDVWKLARVAMIYKGGNKDSKLPSSYRPISLANTIYKIYSSMLQHKLASSVDYLIGPRQFGFRSGRSASEPLFIVRRLIELFERHTAPLYILFLDWAQAFDSVDHAYVESALFRMSVPEPLVRAIMVLYDDCTFFVQDGDHSSDVFVLQRGIRQGCPLSPYLFIIVLSVLTHDSSVSFHRRFSYTPWTYSAENPLTDLEYADDTTLISRSLDTIHRLLHVLQHEALKRGLRLSPSKCQLLGINTDNPVFLSATVSTVREFRCVFCFGDDPLGTRVDPVDTSKYLGSLLSSDASSQADSRHRYCQASAAFRCLSPFFRHASITTPRKLQVYSQIVLAILLYGSESQVYTPAQLTRFNSLHFKALRQILGVKSSFFHRVLQPSDELCSNEHLLRLAHEQAPSLRAPTQIISQKRIEYLGHILRHANQYEHTVCFSSAHAYRQIASPYRRGAPCAHWPEVAMTEAYHRSLLRNAGSFPSPYDLAHDAYQCGTLSMVKHYNGHSMPAWFDNTRMWRLLHPLAQSRSQWKLLSFPNRRR